MLKIFQEGHSTATPPDRYAVEWMAASFWLSRSRAKSLYPDRSMYDWLISLIEQD
jgi:hypothetical protein